MPDTINIVVNETVPNTTVVIDDKSPNILLYLNFLTQLSSNVINTVNNITTDSTDLRTLVKQFSGNWNETVDEVNLIQELTGSWVATEQETNIFQGLSAGWEEAAKFVDDGIVDAGYF